MNTENIKTIFTDYLAKEKTQFAILLNGAWGSGKTYFWKNDLTEIVERQKFKAIYISLNGISKIDALEHLLFLKLIPFIGNQENKSLKAATTMATNLVNQIGKSLMKTTLTDIFKDVSVDTFNFSKYVICFDDLERCQIPIKEVLGFINNYVEHKGLKTIIFSDENNIDPDQKGYDGIKEKVIGRILNFELSIEETLPLLFKKYESSQADFFQFLLENKKVITEILAEYKQYNLRTISFYLDILEKLFPKLKNVDAKYVQEVILFSAIITIEFKKGKLKSSDYKNAKGIDGIDANFYYSHIAGTDKKLKEKVDEIKITYAENFYTVYLDNRIEQYFYYNSVYSYILSGYIDLNELESEIKKRYPEKVSQEIQDFRDLLTYDFRKLSGNDFNKLTKSVLTFAKEGKYSLYEYRLIANFFYFFNDNSLITETAEQIEIILIQGLDIVKTKKQINKRQLENMLRFKDENPGVSGIKEKIKDIHFEIAKEQHVSKSAGFIDKLINGDEDELEFLFENNELSKDFFQSLNNKELFDTLIKISNRQLSHFTELLNKRYNSSNIGEFLYEDARFLALLQATLENYLSSKVNIQKLQKFLLLTLVGTLKETCKHLADTKK